MPIFERLRQQHDLPCTYPLHVASSSGGNTFLRGGFFGSNSNGYGGTSRSTPLSPHAPHCHPSAHWVS